MAYNFISIMGHFHSRSFKANITYKTGFDLSFWEVVVKIYPWKTLSWANKDRQKLIARQMFPFHGIIYSSKLLKKKILSETTVPQAQPAFICSNSAILTVEYSVKYVQS